MYAQITATGTDTLDFLQGQLTQDMGAVTSSNSPLTAWCTPQGRVIATMRLLHLADGIGMVLPAELAAEVIAGLSVYRLRSRVVLSQSDETWCALAVANAPDIELLKARQLLPEARAGASRAAGGVTTVCPDLNRSFVEVFATRDALDGAEVDFVSPLTASDWQAGRIAAGITDIVPATTKKFTPHMLNLDRVDAISFDKGCYAGQEIVARTQHLGSVKRRVAHFRSAAPLAIGDSVQLDGTSVGQVVAAAGHDVLVMLPVDLHGTRLDVGDVSLDPVDPD